MYFHQNLTMKESKPGRDRGKNFTSRSNRAQVTRSHMVYVQGAAGGQCGWGGRVVTRKGDGRQGGGGGGSQTDAIGLTRSLHFILNVPKTGRERQDSPYVLKQREN